MSWRDHAKRVIELIIKEYGHDEKLLKQKLHDAYPFRWRKWYPYKIWLDEIQRQTGKKKPLNTHEKPINPNQGELF